MYAITVRQPWAEAIARHGKTVENRTRRPPWQMLGQRIAIHVGQSVIDWQLMRDGVDPYHDHRFDLYLWATHGDGHRSESVPHAGRIIATARLACVVSKSAVGLDIHGPDFAAGMMVRGSPWFTGPVGWVLADVRPLAVPVGQTCDECGGDGCRDIDDGGNGRDCCCGGSGKMAIRGALYPFALSPEVEAAVLRQERDHA